MRATGSALSTQCLSIQLPEESQGRIGLRHERIVEWSARRVGRRQGDGERMTSHKAAVRVRDEARLEAVAASRAPELVPTALPFRRWRRNM